MFWWIYFPNEVSRIIGTLDRSRLAEDIARSRPREWRLLAEFAAFIDPAVHEFISDIFQRLDVSAFIAHIQAQVKGCEYEFRCLLWTLNRAPEERRKEVAHGFYAEIKNSCQRSETERPQLIRAYRCLDKALAAKLATELAFEATEDKKNVEDADTKEETILRIRQRFAKLDASGEDYIVDDVIAGPAENTHEIQEPTKAGN